MKKLILIAFAAVLMTGCAEDGDPGAQGPAGNANVKSFSFSTTPGSWIASGTPGTNDCVKYLELNISEITQSILDDGMVLVYWETGGYYVQMPVILPIDPTQSINLFYASTLGKVEVDLQLNTLQTPNTASLNWEFKVVVASGINRITHPEINWKDYNSVKKLID